MRTDRIRIVFAVAALAACIGCARAEAPKEGGHEHSEAAKYKAVLHQDGGEVDKEYDLSKPDELNALLDAVKAGKVEHLKKDEEIGIGLILGLKRWDLGIWSILIFLAILFVLGKFAWKPMLQALNEREESIRSALELAERTRKEAAEQHAKLQAQVTEGAGKVREMMEEGRRDALALKDQMIAEAKAEIQAERDRLHREIETAKDSALEELWEKSVVLATQLSSKAIRRQLSVDDHRRLLDETISDLKLAGNRAL